MASARMPWHVFGKVGLLTLALTCLLAAMLVSQDVRQFNGTIKLADTHLIGRDFVNIWHGGALASVDAPDVYDRETYRASLKQVADIEGIYAFSYPPHMLMASVPFGQLPYWAALLGWTVLTTGVFWHAARPFLQSVGLPHWSVFVLPGFWVNLWAGHFGCLVGALALYGWHHARHRPALSGVAFAAMTVKPHLGVLVPLILASRKAWRTIFWAGGATLALIALSGFALGWDSWSVWLQSTLPFQASLLEAEEPRLLYFMMMPTVERLAVWLGLEGAAKLAFSIAFAGLALIPLVKAWRSQVALPDLGLLSIIATFLLLPYVFNYDMVAYDLALLVLAARVLPRLRDWDHLILALAFLVPLFQMPAAMLGFPVAPLFMLAALWILVRHMTAHGLSRT